MNTNIREAGTKTRRDQVSQRRSPDVMFASVVYIHIHLATGTCAESRRHLLFRIYHGQTEANTAALYRVRFRALSIIEHTLGDDDMPARVRAAGPD